MMARGLLTEVKNLHPHKDLQALQTVGYSELFQYLDGEMELEQAVERIKINTRHFAKRQLTWLRRESDLNWFDVNDKEDIIPFINQRIEDVLG